MPQLLIQQYLEPDTLALILLIFKPCDVYNMQAQMRRNQLKLYTPTQALMHQLNNQQDWFCVHQNNHTGRFTYFFFSK